MLSIAPTEQRNHNKVRSTCEQGFPSSLDDWKCNTLDKTQTYETMIYVKSVINVSPPSVKTKRSLMKTSEQESFRIA
jgi:hypothetical protein